MKKKLKAWALVCDSWGAHWVEHTRRHARGKKYEVDTVTVGYRTCGPHRIVKLVEAR